MKGDLYTENEKQYKKVKVGKSFYKILICKTLKFNNKNYVGFIDYNNKEIFIKKGLKKSDFINTLNHELTHAFMYEIYKNKGIQNKKIIQKLRSYEPFIESLSFLIGQNFKFKYS